MSLTTEQIYQRRELVNKKIGQQKIYRLKHKERIKKMEHSEKLKRKTGYGGKVQQTYYQCSRGKEKEQRRSRILILRQMKDNNRDSRKF